MRKNKALFGVSILGALVAAVAVWAWQSRSPSLHSQIEAAAADPEVSALRESPQTAWTSSDTITLEKNGFQLTAADRAALQAITHPVAHPVAHP